MAFDYAAFWRETEGYPWKVELLADRAAVDAEWLWEWLNAEVRRRQRERYPMHAHAYETLDARLERLTA